MLKIISDSREQRPYAFDRYQVETATTGLPVGDYSLAGFTDRVAVERKSLDDLMGCLKGKNRERFERELAWAGSYEWFFVVVEADLRYLNRSVLFKHEASCGAAVTYGFLCSVWCAVFVLRFSGGW